MTTTVLNQAVINAFNTTVVAAFNRGLGMGSEDWKKVAKLIPSTGASNTYAWLSQFPAFKLFVGQRQHKTVKERAYSVENDLYENTLDVPRTSFEDNNLGMYSGIAESYGQSVPDLMNDLVFQALANGFTETCYDGQFFFDTDHPVYPNEDGSGTAVTVSNMQAGTGEPWVLLCTNRAPQPLYLQERNKAEFVGKTDMTSDRVFETDMFSWGGRWRGNSAYGFWQLAYGSKAALSQANFEANFKAMMKFQGDGNRKLNIKPNLLVVGPDNMAAAEALLKAVNKAGGETNTNYNKVELLVSPYLAI